MSDNTKKKITEKYRNLFLVERSRGHQKAFEVLKDKFPELVDRGLPKVSLGEINCEVESIEYGKTRKDFLRIAYSFPDSDDTYYKPISEPLSLGEFLEASIKQNFLIKNI